jgi:hypothetical protein
LEVEGSETSEVILLRFMISLKLHLSVSAGQQLARIK